MGVGHGHGGIHQHVQIRIDLPFRAARSDAVDAPHPRHCQRRSAQIALGDARAVGERGERVLEDVVGRGKNGGRHHERHDRIGHGKPERHGRKACDDAHRDERVGKRVVRVGGKNLAFEALGEAPLVDGHSQIDRERARHHDKRHRPHLGGVRPRSKLRRRARSHLERGQQQEHADHEARIRLELRMPVGMPRVCRTGRERDADEPHHIARRIEHRMDAVGLHRGRPADRSPGVLRRRHPQVQQQNGPQHPPDGAHAIGNRIVGRKRPGHGNPLSQPPDPRSAHPADAHRPARPERRASKTRSGKRRASRTTKKPAMAGFRFHGVGGGI